MSARTFGFEPGPEADPGRVLLVDAANVVGSRPNGWWRDRPGAAAALVEGLGRAVAAGAIDGPVVVVLEGAARAGAEETATGTVRVLHAPGSGDDRLVEAAADLAPAPVLIVSADRKLRDRIAALGGDAVGPDWLLRRLAAVQAG